MNHPILARAFAFQGLPAIGAAALCVSAPAIAAESPALHEAVNALRSIETMRADFTQSNSRGQTVSGVLTLKRPGKIRFQYEKGVPLLIVGDGKALTFVDSQVRQMQRWPIGNSPLGVLLNPARDVSQFGRVVPANAPGLTEVEVRDPRHPEYGTISLAFARKASAPGGLELLGWSTIDSQNQRTTVRLFNRQYGVPLADSQFRVLDTSVRPHK
jgi:outer membrane lipoprotein-sorting protein